MNAMSNEHDYWSGWQESQPPRTDTQLPYQPPLVKADPVAVWLVIVVFVCILSAICGLVAFPERWAR